MSATAVSPGSVVRYEETKTRWYIATVRAVKGETVSLAYIGGYEEDVDLRKVSLFAAYLRSREKTLSLTREDLCHRLYGEKFRRLPQARLNEVQRFFRAHGISYRPAVWPPGQRIRISVDESFVAPDEAEVDDELDALLPRWLEPNRLPPGSRDPLGFQTHAERLANQLLPGLTVATSRIGYYGFIAWVVSRLNAERSSVSGSRREILHRLERTLALCEFVQHGQDDHTCRLLGQRSKTQILQSAIRDRFHVPARILKNQESAGALRLYSTSLESTGFATSAPELAAEGLLPFALTDLGTELANEFKKRVPSGFWEFAISDKAMNRDLLRAWGKKLCFSRLGTKTYRDVFLEGFLLGGTREAQARHHTVRLLFDRGLLGAAYVVPRRRLARVDSVAEDDAGAMEDDAEETGLANCDVLLRFYGEKPKPENALMQQAAVFELLGLALTAIFAHAVHALDAAGRASVRGLADAIVTVKKHGTLWKMPFGRLASRTGSARDLEAQLMDAEDLAAAAAIGGTLIARVQADAAYAATVDGLSATPVVEILGAIDPSQSLAASYGALLEQMVTRHEQVSRNKNRQRWCYLEDGGLVKDDLRPLGYGWHAMRFPQLWSLCRDLGLTRQDIMHAR